MKSDYHLSLISCQQLTTSNQQPTANSQLPSPRGFTLIETLVAMMVLSISLVVILQLFSGGLKGSRLSDSYTRAIFHAKEKMEEILLIDEFLETTTFTGEFDDGFRWKAEITHVVPYDESDDDEIRQYLNIGGVDTFHIRVMVAWLEGEKEKSVDVSTLKIATLINEDDAGFQKMILERQQGLTK